MELEKYLENLPLEKVRQLRKVTGAWCGAGLDLFMAIKKHQKARETPPIPNTAVIKTSCGQGMTLELDNIDKNQDINEVTIRGVRYTPAQLRGLR